MLNNLIDFNYINNYCCSVLSKMGTVKLAWIFTIEKLKTCAKSLITCICTKFFLLKTQIPDCGFPSSFYSALLCVFELKIFYQT
jgi:hypothetical protein